MRELSIPDCKVKPDGTESILKALMESESLTKLEIVCMRNCANFDCKEHDETLVNFIRQAKGLQTFDISEQPCWWPNPHRDIIVEVSPGRI